MDRVSVIVGSRDRPTEIGLLVQSLRTQTFQDWDLVIVDDASRTPSSNFYFIMALLARCKLEGHGVRLVRNGVSFGVSRMRNQTAKIAMEEFPNNKYLLRVDDDTIMEPDFMQKLLDVIAAGYDLASGVTPGLNGPDWKRQVNFVEPIINRVVLDQAGHFITNGDDCGFQYLEGRILPTHHFRSTALYDRKIHDQGIYYPENLSKSGMREEEFFSFKIILAGMKLGVHTQAVHWHLMCPSGGHRTATQEQHVMNQKMLNRWTRQQFETHGDFIKKYNEKLGIDETDALKSIDKSSNYLMTKEE